MQNLKEISRIYLSGGGNEKQSFPLDKFFFDTLPENGRFLYIPIALRGHKLYPTASEWMKSLVGLHGRMDVQWETADDLSVYDLASLKKFDGIYIGGGNTWSLIKEFRDSGFAHILIEFIKSGGDVYGGSAGAIILGSRVDTHDDENKVSLADVSGFDQLKGYSVACHFHDKQSDRFKKWAIDAGKPIICLPEETGLIIEQGSARCVGALHCILYFADGTQNEVNPGESFEL